MPSRREWFCTLLDSASDVYFRYALTTPRGDILDRLRAKHA